MHIENDIDLTAHEMDNTEISMRILSDVNSGEYFYTDLNGFQVPLYLVMRDRERKK